MISCYFISILAFHCPDFFSPMVNLRFLSQFLQKRRADPKDHPVPGGAAEEPHPQADEGRAHLPPTGQSGQDRNPAGKYFN